MNTLFKYWNNRIKYRFISSNYEMDQVKNFLSDHNLSTDGIEKAITLTARQHDEIVGVISLQINNQIGLLKSFFVINKMRSKGIGNKLYKRIINHANIQGIRQLYLITETADDYFYRMGFRHLAKNETPEIVKYSYDFMAKCCECARVMNKALPLLWTYNPIK
ncbi:MAG TPA: GNAT family N-acetyltransferase [Balneolales bacterium]|nr:GNAT family N-acetyltransferase [Balneolales bacterium]